MLSWGPHWQVRKVRGRGRWRRRQSKRWNGCGCWRTWALLVFLPIPSKNLKPCILNQAATPLDTLETNNVPTSNCVIILSAMSGCRSCTMRKQSAPVGTFPKLKLASTLAMPGAQGEQKDGVQARPRWRRVAVRKILLNQGALISTRSLLRSTST